MGWEFPRTKSLHHLPLTFDKYANSQIDAIQNIVLSDIAHPHSIEDIFVVWNPFEQVHIIKKKFNLPAITDFY